jgi:acyl-CoA synthetase
VPDLQEPGSAATPLLGLPTWPPRTVPAALEDRWRGDGMWTDDSLGMLLDRGLRAQPDLRCTIYSDVHPATGTFAELRSDALAVAGALQARGIGPGDPVAFHLPNWREAVVSFYAAAFLGAVVVPIVHFYGPKEVGYILRRTGVRALITGTSFGPIDFLAGLDALQPELVDVDVVAVVDLAEPGDGRIPFSDLLAGPSLDGPIAVDAAGPALVAYTSGTTADPKGVIHSHRSIGAETRQLSATKAPGQPPQLVGVPVGHAMGMLGALLMPVQRGEPIHLTDVWNPTVILQLMLEHGLGSGSGATYFLTSLLDHPDLTPEHLALMHHIGLGGSAVPAAVAERATDAGLSIVRMYGSTEHPSITGALHTDPLEKRTTTDGRALPGVELRLVDATGRDVAVGEPGEIISRGPDCFAGYTDPALTAAAFDDDGWFHTEDVGILDEDGYLRITDRLKDVIIRGGENVSAVEVEELIARLEGVGEVAVVAGPDARLGERVCAFIRPGSQPPPDLDRVRDSLRDAGLARQKWPEALYVVDDFPRTPSGKIQKAQLRARLQVEHDDR